MVNKRQVFRFLTMLLLLGCCLWIGWNVPYTHDDWDWGQPAGLEWWLSGSMNNRYTGSFFVVLMTRSPLIKTLVIGGCLFFLPLLAALTVQPRGRRTHWFPLTMLGCAVLMSIPIISWRQTYGWVSACANFVVAGLWLLVLILLVQAGTAADYRGWVIPALLFPLTLAGQLLAENVTILITAAALVLTVWSLAARRGRLVALSMLAGALIGMFIMFDNPLYGELASTGYALGGIRALPFQPGDGLSAILAAVLNRYFGLILPSLFESYPAVWILICTGVLRKAYRQGYRLTIPRYCILAFLLPVGLFCAGYFWSAWLAAKAQSQNIDWVCPWPALRSWGAAAIVLLVLLCLIWNWKQDWQKLAFFAGALLLSAPFAVVRENGPRCHYCSGVLLLLLGLSLWEDCDWNTWQTAAAGLLMSAAVLFHLQIYQVVGGCNTLRLQLLQEAAEQGAYSVVLPTESRRYYYTWGHNPESGWRAVSYRNFYGVPAEMELIFLPPGSYELWPEITQEMMDNAAIF